VITIAHPDGRTETQIVNALALALDVSGTLDLTTRSSYRPETLTQQRATRVFAGDAAWRELADAKIEEESLA
jgi:hypothetical protein